MGVEDGSNNVKMATIDGRLSAAFLHVYVNPTDFPRPCSFSSITMPEITPTMIALIGHVKVWRKGVKA